MENHINDQKFDDGVEDVEPANIKSSQVAVGEPSFTIENNCYVHAQPIFTPIWRGSFNIYNGNIGTTDGLAAHLSSKACFKVFEVSSLLPPVLHFEILPRLDVWPKSFDQSKPTDDNIALYFFQENLRDERAFDAIVDDIICQDLALKAVVQNAELLIFTSIELPLPYWRFQGKHYLWGIFRGNKASALNQPKGRCSLRNSSIDVGTGEGRNLTEIWDMEFPLHPLSNNADVQKLTITTQLQEVPLHTMLEENKEAKGTNRHEQLDRVVICTSGLNLAIAFDELINPDETVPEGNSFALVGSYYVKPSMAPILLAILDKHGDIAQDCIIPSNCMISCELEKVCEVIQELRDISFSRIRSHHLKSLYSAVNGAESIKLRVNWLRHRHNELKEALHSIKQYKVIKNALIKSLEVAESTKRTLDSKKANLMKMQYECKSLERQFASFEAENIEVDKSMALDSKKADLMKLQSEWKLLKCRLASLEAETGTLDGAMKRVTCKYEQFRHQYLMDGLL